VNLPAGLAIATGILVLLPLVSVGVGRRWRDPPRERWGISRERLEAAAAQSPELVAHRRRIELGVADPRLEAKVNRAIRTGTAAPPELRTATRELAALRIDGIDRGNRHGRVMFALWLGLATAMLAVGVFGRTSFLAVYSGLWFVRAYLHSPWYVRWRRGRAEAAVVANAPE
jgi:hypothetical protein